MALDRRFYHQGRARVKQYYESIKSKVPFKIVKQALFVMCLFIVTSWVVWADEDFVRQDSFLNSHQFRAMLDKKNFSNVPSYESIKLPWMHMLQTYATKSVDKVINPTRFNKILLRITSKLLQHMDPLLDDGQSFKLATLLDKEQEMHGHSRKKRQAERESNYDLPIQLVRYWPRMIDSIRNFGYSSAPYPLLHQCSDYCQQATLDPILCKQVIIEKISKLVSESDAMEEDKEYDLSILAKTKQEHCLSTDNSYKRSNSREHSKHIPLSRQLLTIIPNKLKTSDNHLYSPMLMGDKLTIQSEELQCSLTGTDINTNSVKKSTILQNVLTTVYTRTTDDLDNPTILSVGVSVTQELPLFQISSHEYPDNYYYKLERALSNDSCTKLICDVCVQPVPVVYTGECNISLNQDSFGSVHLCSSERNRPIFYMVKDIISGIHAFEVSFKKDKDGSAHFEDLWYNFPWIIKHPLYNHYDESIQTGFLLPEECRRFELSRAHFGSTKGLIKCGSNIVHVSEKTDPDMLCYYKYKDSIVKRHICHYWGIYRYLICLGLAFLAFYILYKINVLCIIFSILSVIVALPAYLCFRFSPRFLRCKNCQYPWSPCHECPEVCICGYRDISDPNHICPITAYRDLAAINGDIVTSQPYTTSPHWDEETGILQEDGTYIDVLRRVTPDYESQIYHAHANPILAQDVYTMHDNAMLDHHALTNALKRKNHSRASLYPTYFYFQTFATRRNPYTRNICIILSYLLVLWIVSLMIPKTLACNILDAKHLECAPGCKYEPSTDSYFMDNAPCECIVSGICAGGTYDIVVYVKDSTNRYYYPGRLDGCPDKNTDPIEVMQMYSLAKYANVSDQYYDVLAEVYGISKDEAILLISDCISQSKVHTLVYLMMQDKNALIQSFYPTDSNTHDDTESLITDEIEYIRINDDVPTRAIVDITYLNPLSEALLSVPIDNGLLGVNYIAKGSEDYAFSHNYIYFSSNIGSNSIINVEMGASINNALRIHPVFDGLDSSIHIDAWIPEMGDVYHAVHQYRTSPTDRTESQSYTTCFKPCNDCFSYLYTGASNRLRHYYDEDVGLGKKTWPGVNVAMCNGAGCAGIGSGCLCSICTNIPSQTEYGDVYNLVYQTSYVILCLKISEKEPTCTKLTPGNPINANNKLQIFFSSPTESPTVESSNIVIFSDSETVYYGDVAKKGSSANQFGHPQLDKDFHPVHTINIMDGTYKCYPSYDQEVTVKKCTMDTFKMKSDLIALNNAFYKPSSSELIVMKQSLGSLKIQLALNANDIKIFTNSAKVSASIKACSGCCNCLAGINCAIDIKSSNNFMCGLHVNSAQVNPSSLPISAGDHQYNVSFLTNDCLLSGSELQLDILSPNNTVMTSVPVRLPRVENGMKLDKGYVRTTVAENAVRVPELFGLTSIGSIFGNIGHWLYSTFITFLFILLLIFIVFLFIKILYYKLLAATVSRNMKKSK